MLTTPVRPTVTQVWGSKIVHLVGDGCSAIADDLTIAEGNHPLGSLRQPVIMGNHDHSHLHGVTALLDQFQHLMPAAAI